MKIKDSKSFEMEFSIVKQISSGGFSTVHLGVNKLTNRHCAIKTIKKEKARRDSVLNEIEICSRMSEHPNIVTIQGAFLALGVYHLVFEYVKGKNLVYYFSKRKPGPWTCKSIAKQLARALKYCHENYIVHRDVKPKNILMCARGKIKLADFGLSVDTKKNPEKLKGLSGSVKFIAPEIVGGGKYGPEIDMWSYGVTMFYVITGKYLFSGKDKETIFEKISNGNFMAEISWLELSKTELDFFLGVIERVPADRISWEELLRKVYIL